MRTSGVDMEVGLMIDRAHVGRSPDRDRPAMRTLVNQPEQ
jgi:hypothetical protein